RSAAVQSGPKRRVGEVRPCPPQLRARGSRARVAPGRNGPWAGEPTPDVSRPAAVAVWAAQTPSSPTIEHLRRSSDEATQSLPVAAEPRDTACAYPDPWK